MQPTLEKKDKVVRVRMSEDMLNKLEEKANQRGLNVSELIRDIIWRYLNETICRNGKWI